MKFMFPATKFVRENNIFEQVDHLESELIEVRKAKSIEELAEELLDVIHSAETSLRILLRDKFIIDTDLERIRKKTLKKNRERGYYD